MDSQMKIGGKPSKKIMEAGGSSKKRDALQNSKKNLSITKPAGMLSPIYEQPGDTCTAIAVVGVIEAIYNKDKDPKEMVVLSVEDLVEWYLQENIMKGGVADNGRVYNQIIISGGLAKTTNATSNSLMDFAIERQEEIVRARRANRRERERREEKREVTISGFKDLDPKNLADILSQHPVVGVLSVYPSFTQLREGEVYTGQPTQEEVRSKKKAILHSVQVYKLVTSEETGPYWEVKNSYGPKWSNNGYGRISMSMPFESLTYPTGVAKTL